LLPSHADNPNPKYSNGKLDHITRRNHAFSETAMCQMLLNSMPFQVKAKWKADHPGQKIPTDRDLLVTELQTLLDEHNITKKQKSQQGGGGGGKKNSDKSPGSKQGGGTPRTPKNKKKCSRCERKGERDNVKFSHRDEDCDKYHPDLSAKIGSHERQLRAQEARTPPLSETRERKRKKSSKKSSKKDRKSSKSKKRSRRRRSDSDSDSRSSSSSSSEGSYS